MSVLKYFKNIPRSPPIGRQTLIVIFFFKFATRSLVKKKACPPHPNGDPGLGFSFSEQQRRNIMIYNDIFPQTKNIYDMMSVFHGKGPFWLTRYGTSPNAQIVLAKFVVKMKTRFNHKHPIVVESSLVMQLCRVSGC